MMAALDAVMPSDLRRLLHVAGGNWALAAGALLMFLSAFGLVAAPWLIGKAVNDLRRGSEESLLEVSLAVAGAGLATALMTGMAMWLLGRYAVTVGMRIRELLNDRLLSASLDLYRTHPTGQLVARATADVEPIKLFLTSGVSFVAQLVGTLAFAMTIMLLIDPGLAAIALAPFPVAVFVQLRYARRTRVATADAEQRRGEVAAEAADNVRGAKLVMSLGREAERRTKFDHAVEEPASRSGRKARPARIETVGCVSRRSSRTTSAALELPDERVQQAHVEASPHDFVSPEREVGLAAPLGERHGRVQAVGGRPRGHADEVPEHGQPSPTRGRWTGRRPAKPLAERRRCDGDRTAHAWNPDSERKSCSGKLLSAELEIAVDRQEGRPHQNPFQGLVPSRQLSRWRCRRHQQQHNAAVIPARAGLRLARVRVTPERPLRTSNRASGSVRLPRQADGQPDSVGAARARARPVIPSRSSHRSNRAPVYGRRSA